MNKVKQKRHSTRLSSTIEQVDAHGESEQLGAAKLGELIGVKGDDIINI
jgi:hypothetical protein